MFADTLRMTKKACLGVLLPCIFLSVLFFSLVHISSNMGALGVSQGCPFMVEGSALCQMSFAEHLSSWKELSLATPLLLLIVLLLPTVHPLRFCPSLFFRQVCAVWQLDTNSPRVKTFIAGTTPHYLQELFAQGLLHPKLF